MGKSAPAPPDPKDTASAQTGTNVGTSIANNMMGLIDQNTPYGSLDYEQSGTYTYKDPYTGKSYDIPQFTANTTLSPEEAARLETIQGAQGNLASLAADRASFLKDYLGGTGDQTDSLSGKLFDIGRQRLDPMFGERRSALETRLANQGITMGSDAWNTAMRQFGEQENDAYNQLLLQGRGQAASEVNMPINQITALLSGSQVASPGVNVQSPQGMPYTDVAGLINENYNQRLGQWQQNQGLMGGLFSGLGGIASAGIMASDRRLKADARRIGAYRGVPVWSYRYLGTAAPQVGVMADEVPHAAIVSRDGFAMVDYGKVWA